MERLSLLVLDVAGLHCVHSAALTELRQNQKFGSHVYASLRSNSPFCMCSFHLLPAKGHLKKQL